jgi:hypothetical protein
MLTLIALLPHAAATTSSYMREQPYSAHVQDASARFASTLTISGSGPGQEEVQTAAASVPQGRSKFGYTGLLQANLDLDAPLRQHRHLGGTSLQPEEARRPAAAHEWYGDLAGNAAREEPQSLLLNMGHQTSSMWEGEAARCETLVISRSVIPPQPDPLQHPPPCPTYPLPSHPSLLSSQEVSHAGR